MWSDFADWLAGLVDSALTTIIEWFFDALYFVLDALLSLFEGIVNAIPVPSEWSSLNPWDAFSPQVLFILDALNIGTCLVIIFAAWGIRLALNFIPGSLTRV